MHNQSKITNFDETTQVFGWRERRRRNCLTETTRTRRRCAALIKSRSRLRSSSRVTRNCDLPRMAASRISLSSGSRQIFRSPEIWTTFARAAISRTNVSASSGGYIKRRISRGRLRTSMISVSCDSDVITLKSPRRQAATIFPGGPVGLRKAETQTLVSSRAASGTAFRLDLGPRPSQLRLDDLLWDRPGTSFHPVKQALEFIPPLRLWIEGNQDVGLLLQWKRLEGSQDPILVHRSKRFFRWTRPSRLCHNGHYSGAPGLRSSISPQSLVEEKNDD